MDFWSYIAPSIPAYKLKKVIADLEDKSCLDIDGRDCQQCHARGYQPGVDCRQTSELCQKELDRRAAVKKGR